MWPFASLYHEMGKVGLAPEAVKSMLLWEAGAVLGAGFPDADVAATVSPGHLSPAVQAAIDYHAAKARGEDPEPPQATRAPATMNVGVN